MSYLTAYQSADYAREYRGVVDRVLAAEAKHRGSDVFTKAVATNLFKLMAYKDEYEVARLHTDRSFLDKVAAQFEGDYKLNYHLAPPLVARKNDKGELQKRQFGPWMLTGFKLLAKLKGLRGTPFDVFGKSEERKVERALIDEYTASIDEVLQTLSAQRLALATDIARIPEDIRGYGHVKDRHLAAARQKWVALMSEWRAGGQRRAA